MKVKDTMQTTMGIPYRLVTFKLTGAEQTAILSALKYYLEKMKLLANDMPENSRARADLIGELNVLKATISSLQFE